MSGFCRINLTVAWSSALFFKRLLMFTRSMVTSVWKRSLTWCTRACPLCRRSRLFSQAASERGPRRRALGPGFAASPSVATGCGAWDLNLLGPFACRLAPFHEIALGPRPVAQGFPLDVLQLFAALRLPTQGQPTCRRASQLKLPSAPWPPSPRCGSSRPCRSSVVLALAVRASNPLTSQ